MKGGEGNLQVIDIDDVIMKKCPITIVVILNLLVYSSSTIQYSTISIILYDSKCNRTILHYIMSCSVSFAGYFLVRSLLSAFPAYLRFPV